MYWGIDSGSTSINVVLLNDEKEVVDYRIAESGCRPVDTAEQLMKDICKENCLSMKDTHTIISTGYGRRNIRSAQNSFTEVTCHAYGVQYLYPEAETVIDIGGQDCKAISLSRDGGVDDFIMNDKCAAGTGRFLEVMARVLQMDIETFSRCGLQATSPYPISSTCTVFAESEVISGIAKGITPENLVAGLQQAVADRVASMAAGFPGNVVLTGGVAKSDGIRQCLEKKFPGLQVPFEPQITGALGAALMGWIADHG